MHYYESLFVDKPFNSKTMLSHEFGYARKTDICTFLCNVHFCEKGQYKGNPREREFSDSSMHILLSEIKVDNSRS